MFPPPSYPNISTLEFEPVKSSNLHSVAYHEPSGKLFVRFRDKQTDNPTNKLYVYRHVFRSDFDALMKAESTGSYFNTYIKQHPDLFPYTMYELPPDQPLEIPVLNPGESTGQVEGSMSNNARIMSISEKAHEAATELVAGSISRDAIDLRITSNLSTKDLTAELFDREKKLYGYSIKDIQADIRDIAHRFSMVDSPIVRGALTDVHTQLQALLTAIEATKKAL